MVKPKRLKKGDTVAVVCLSSGMLGDEKFLHKYTLGKQRLEERFGLHVVAMPNALKGSEYLYAHPEKRAEDLIAAFKDPAINGIITAIGGDDGVRLLPYIDQKVIHDNPKVFTGFSDTNVHHFLLFKAGVVSYYGPALMTDFANYGGMDEYTEDAVRRLLFEAAPSFEMPKCLYWVCEGIPWDEKNIDKHNHRTPDEKGYEVLQGEGTVRGRLLGGCVDAFPMYIGTSAWPAAKQWKDAMVFLETSEDSPAPNILAYYLRNLGAQGIWKHARGLIVGKPCKGKYYEEYKPVYRKVLKEFGREDLPVLYNANFGHSQPIGVIPYGIECELDTRQKKITLLESVVE